MNQIVSCIFFIDKEVSNQLKNLFDFPQIFTHVGQNVNPAVFYHVQRPLLAGFFPDEILFEGTEEISKPVNWVSSPKGPSAGQSTIFVLLDSFLGINHGDVAKEFQEEMILYMPRQHKKMILSFKEKLVISVRQLIMGKYFIVQKAGESVQ